MNRSELSHILRAASRIVGQAEVVVIGSQAILGSFDEDELPAAAIASIEADVTFLDDDADQKADLVEAALGELSPFHLNNGYYAQGVNIGVAILPDGWRHRLVRYRSRSSEPGHGLCLDPHDLAVSKLAASREKDHEFVGALLHAGMLDVDTLLERSALLEVV